jgi:hypothetical protein
VSEDYLAANKVSLAEGNSHFLPSAERGRMKQEGIRPTSNYKFRMIFLLCGEYCCFYGTVIQGFSFAAFKDDMKGSVMKYEISEQTSYIVNLVSTAVLLFL